jgi:hypothetical protein
MRENMRFVREQAARLWAQVKLSDRVHVREFLQGYGRAVTDEEADAWRVDISKMIDSGQIMHRPGGWFSSPLVQVTFPVDRKTCLVLHPGPGGFYGEAVLGELDRAYDYAQSDAPETGRCERRTLPSECRRLRPPVRSLSLSQPSSPRQARVSCEPNPG